MSFFTSRIRTLKLWQLCSVVVSLSALLIMSKGLFRWLVLSVFNEPREDMSHGWVIPFFTLFLFVRKRAELKKAIGSPSALGFCLVLFGMLVFALGSLGEQMRLTQLGAIFAVWAIFYAVWGIRFAKVAMVPVAFLLFTVPLAFLDVVTVKLRIVISMLASFLLNGFGIPVQRTGTGLFCLAGEGFSLDIADPCSGLHSVFALIALTTAYGYLDQKTARGKWALFFCAIPIAMLGNLVRIFSIAVVARFFGQGVATGYYHDFSPWCPFIIAVLVIVRLSKFFTRVFSKYEKNVTNEEADTSHGQVGEIKRFYLKAALLILTPAMIISSSIYIANAPRPQLEGVDFITSELKPLPGYEMRYPFFCQNEHCGNITEGVKLSDIPEKCPECDGRMDTVSLGERRLLPEDTIFYKANYYDETGDVWRVAVIVNGASRLSIHRPEICLPAQGMSIEKGRVETFKLDDGSELDVHCMDVRPRSQASTSRMGHSYFFVSKNDRAASHSKRIFISVRDRAIYRRITRWSMVTLSGEEPFADTPERRAATERFLSQLMPMLFNIESGGDAR